MVTRLALAVLALVALAMAAPAAGAVQTTPPAPLTQPVDETQGQWLTRLDDSGSVIFARLASDGAALAVATPAAPASIALTDTGHERFSLASAPNGAAVAAWPNGDDIQIATREPGQAAFSPPRTLVTAQGLATAVDVAITPNGAAAVLVGDGGGEDPTQLSVYRRRPGGDFGPAEPIKGNGGIDARIALRPDGAAAVFALPNDREAVIHPLQLSQATATGGFGPLKRLSGKGVDVNAWRIATAPDGRVAVVWTGARGPSLDENVIGASTGPVTRLKPGREIFRGGNANQTAVALGGKNSASVAWRTRKGIRVGPLTEDGIGKTRRHGRDSSARFPALTIDSAGRRTLFWQEGEGARRVLLGLTAGARTPQTLGGFVREVHVATTRDRTYALVNSDDRLHLRESVAGRSFGKAELVDAIDDGSLYDARILTTPGGRAAVAWGWSDYDSGNQLLMTARVRP